MEEIKNTGSFEPVFHEFNGRKLELIQDVGQIRVGSTVFISGTTEAVVTEIMKPEGQEHYSQPLMLKYLGTDGKEIEGRFMMTNLYLDTENRK